MSVFGGLYGRGRAGQERGASLIEFAVIAPMLLLLLFGVIEFARLIYGYTSVWSAAREGARYATTVGDTDGNGIPNYLDCDAIIEAALAKAVGTNLGAGDVSVRYLNTSDVEVGDCVVNPPAPSGGDHIDSGFTIEVEASAIFDAVVPVLSAFIDGIDLSSTQSRSIFKGIVGGQ